MLKEKSKEWRLHQENQKQLQSILDQKDWRKQGGLKSTYWKAFHFPSTLSSLGDGVEAYKKETYLPLLKLLKTPESFRVVSHLLSQQDKSAQSDAVVQLSKNLTALIEQKPLFFENLIQGPFDAFVDFSEKALFSEQQVLHAPHDLSATLKLATTKQKREAYVAMREEFLNEITLPISALMPWLMNEAINPITNNYIETILPAMVKALIKNNPVTPVLVSSKDGTVKLTVQPAWTQNKKTMLETMWRLVILESDLRAGEMPERTIIKSIQEQLKTYAESLIRKEKPLYGPHLPVTHDNLDATIPDSFIA